MVITGAAVCSGALFLIPGAADSIAQSQEAMATACHDVARRLVAAESIVLLSTRAPAGADRPAREISAGAGIPLSSLRRSDLGIQPITLLGRPSSRCGLTVTDPAVGTMVGAVLLNAADCRLPVTIIEVGADPAEVAVQLRDATDSTERIGLLVIADGSACHGDAAPGKRDDRATGFDAAISAALTAGSPGQLAAACTDRSLARELLATVDPLTVLALLTAAGPPDTAEMPYSGTPFGVGHWVASWDWLSG